MLPGVFLVEGMAQTGGILLLHDDPDRQNKLLYFMSVDRARFRRPERKPDRTEDLNWGPMAKAAQLAVQPGRLDPMRRGP